jgi:hypothetical protein
MKTSNKILLGFLIFVFATPVFLFMSFRNKIQKGEFTVSAPPSNQYKHSGLLARFKVVRVVGLVDPGVLSCHLFPADSSWYAYNNYSNGDSIKVEQKGDTLLLKYIDIGLQENRGNTRSELVHLRIDLHAPAFNNVVVEGASVYIDTANATRNSETYFDLHDQAYLSLGTGGQVKTTQVNQTTVTEMSGALLKKVTINASSSRIELGQFAMISDLHLQLLGTSTVSVHNNSQIGQLTGFLSDSSTVEANWKNVRRLAALTGQ